MGFLHIISDKAFRFFPERWFLMMREGYFSLRRRLAPVTQILHGTFDTNALRKHLDERIGSEFEILMIHSSFNFMIPTYTGTPLELVRMLIEFCGPDRTLVMPAFYFGDPKIGNVHKTFTAHNKFDLKRTPSQMGLVTELFRRTKGVKQSRHPVYRVSALGPLAQELVKGHENASKPAGFNSPFEYMATHNTLILGIGKSFEVMTHVHHADSIMGDDFPVPTYSFDSDSNTEVIVVDGGEEVPVYLPRSGIQWRFNIAKLPSLLKKGDLKCWKFHNVPFFSARARDITDSLIDAAKSGKTLYEPK